TRQFYNPFITVDYMQNVDANPTTGNIVGDVKAAGPPDNEITSTTAAKKNVNWRQSDGRLQPYVGYSTLNGTWKQLQTAAVTNTSQPQTTFQAPNNNPAQTPFSWLIHLDRQISSPMELLHVSGFKPHELTQEFVNPTGALKPFNHRVPWFDED